MAKTPATAVRKKDEASASSFFMRSWLPAAREAG